MKNLKSTLPIISMALLLAVVLFPSCKAKKVAAPTPAPVEAPAPAPVVQAPVDTDGDSVTDDKDNCPTVAGTAANNGCPEPVVVVPTFKYENLQFELNSSVLKTSYYAVLDVISSEMRKYPALTFEINGHASAEGTEERNKTLSVDRATAVKTYLVNSGVNSTQLYTKGFGESMPIASNDTEEGRQVNRRVEIKKR
ncbi:MAG: OmpA family protein [Sphingobacteriaceae bacterium]